MSKHFHKLTVKEVVRETPKTVSILFEVPEEIKEEFEYKAGQYLTIKALINGEETRRSYSLSSFPGEDNIKISSKTVENGKMSNFLDKQLQSGMELEVMPPEGKFTTEGIPTTAELVLFAAGSGITPIFSLLKDSLLNHDHRKVSLLYCNSFEDEIIFREDLQNLQRSYPNRFKMQLFVSRSTEEGMGFVCGRIDESSIKQLMNSSFEGQHFFICGPEGMIRSTKTSLENLNVPKENIHIEYFASPKSEEAAIRENLGGEVNEVKVIIDGEEHLITLKPKESILDAAIRLELDPPFSCQSGVCTTCQAKVLQGDVDMQNNFGLSDEEVEEGYVLTCISFPKTPGVIVSWDEV